MDAHRVFLESENDLIAKWMGKKLELKKNIYL